MGIGCISVCKGGLSVCVSLCLWVCFSLSGGWVGVNDHVSVYKFVYVEARGQPQV